MILGLSYLFYLFGCSKEKEEILAPMATAFSSCDPLDEALCALPYPSSFYLKENAEKPSGWQINFAEDSLPINIDGLKADPRFWNEKDGFSPLTPIVTFFPDLSVEGVVGHDDIGAYEAVDAKIVLIDIDTGQRVPYFAELDMSHSQADRRALVIRPVRPMEWGHRHVVGIRGLQKTDGSLADSSEAFLALRDNIETRNFDIEGRREHFEEVIFPALEAEGFSRSETQLAWDFVVASKEAVTEKVLFMKEDLLQRLPEGGPAYTIDKVDVFSVEENEHVAKRIFGTMTVPYYTEEPKAGTILSRDENGMPIYMGETEREFTVIVPRSLWEQGISGPILQYGHGLLGDQTEVQDDYLGELADRYGYVLIAVDWAGMSSADVTKIMIMLVDDVGRFAMIPERTQQGFMELISAMQLIKGELAQDQELMTVDAEGNPVSVVDTEERYFYGNSQGGILGTAYTAISSDFERATLGVSGAPFSILLPRSANFESFMLVFQTMYPDYMNITLWVALMQTIWDSGGPTGYIDSIKKDPFPDNEPKEVLIQVAIGDPQVSTLGAHVQARSVGAGLVFNPTRDVWGLEELADGAMGSGLSEWDYGLEEPFESVPGSQENNPHGRTRKEFEAQEQMNHFFKTGELVNFCDGLCVK